MTKPINIPNVFASATSAIPLSQLDQDFSTLANATNDLATYSNYVADTGAANSFITNYPSNTNTNSLTTGLRLQFKAANANSGASTLNVQVNGASIGTAAIRLTDGSALPANTIIAGALVDVMYDGTNFQLMNDPSGGQEVITNLTLSGNLTVTGTSNFTGNVTANVANTTTSTITNLSSGNVTITGGTISNVTLDNVTVDVETFSNITINGTATFAAGTVSAPSITTSGDTNTGIFFPAADTIAFTEGGVESMRIDSSGNVGIGTNSPSAPLDIQSNSGGTGIRVRGRASANAGAIRYFANDNTTQRARIESNDTSFEINSVANLPITISTNDTERMRIDSSGNVGIGTSSPAAVLNCVNASYDGYGQILLSDGATNSTTKRSGINQAHYTNSEEPFTIIGGASTSTDNIVRIGGNDATATLNASTRIVFYTATNNTTTASSASERMRITSGGEVYIAGTTDQGAYNLQCNGTGVWGAGAYVNGSDARIKEDIAPIQSGLDVVEKLNPVTYRYKENWSKDQSIQTGFIAQELLTALDGQVYVDGIVQQGGEYMSVAYQNIIPILTKAIQELSAKVEAQAAEIALLKSK